MGKNKKAHAAKVLARNEKVRIQVSNVAVKGLQKTSTNNQIKVMSVALDEGRLKESKLRKVIEKNAKEEMGKGAEKLFKKGKQPTVELLMVEYWGEPKFRKLANHVGLDEFWFTELAKAECERWEEIDAK